jgi:hypothetical protein
MSPDYSKRSYLLPKGCKDLIDVLEISVSETTSVQDLAGLLGQEPVRIIADLMRMGVFATTAEQKVNFETVSKMARKYGYTAKRTA